MITRYIFDGGKYEVLRNDSTYETILYRNGEYWEVGTIDAVGYKLFHSMLNEIDRLKEYEFMYKELCE